jgi:hypothetical protein
VGGSGNIYVADSDEAAHGGYGALKEMPPGCDSAACVTAILGPLLSQPWSPGDLAVDPSGNVYFDASINDTNLVVEKLDLATPPSLVFVDDGVGIQSSDSPKKVTLENIGNAPLTFPVPPAGENPSVSANFTLDSSTTCPEVLSSGEAGALAAGAICVLAVDFYPHDHGRDPRDGGTNG